MQIGRVDTAALKRATLLGLLLITTGSEWGFSASFDCKKAKTEVEKTICANPELSKLDEELAAAYRDAIGKAGQTEKAKLRKEQAAWLRARNACKDTLCIEVMYRTRNAMLTAEAATRAPASADAPAAFSYGRFWLTYGHGVKVCEAYLERLNQSSYEHHPRCDRPEDDSVPGFRALGRVKLSAEEMQPFWAPVSTFLASGKVQDWKRGDEESRKLGLRPRFGSVEEQLETIRGEATLRVFRYEPPIDIDNDGVTDPVIVWRAGSCRPFGDLSLMHYWDSIPIVLNAGGDGSHVERTRRIFGHPSGGYRLSTGKMATEFRPIGRTMGIFQFDGAYYMDTFFDGWGDFNGYRQHDPGLGQYDPEIAKRLAVFLRRGGETKQVCEYWFEDFYESTAAATRQ